MKLNATTMIAIIYGQTRRRNLKICFNGHISHIKFDRGENSAGAKHCLKTGHTI